MTQCTDRGENMVAGFDAARSDMLVLFSRAIDQAKRLGMTNVGVVQFVADLMAMREKWVDPPTIKGTGEEDPR